MALKVVQPSSKREGFVTVPDVKWEDIGSLQDIRQELQMAILVSQNYLAVTSRHLNYCTKRHSKVARIVLTL